MSPTWFAPCVLLGLSLVGCSSLPTTPPVTTRDASTTDAFTYNYNGDAAPIVTQDGGLVSPPHDAAVPVTDAASNDQGAAFCRSACGYDQRCYAIPTTECECDPATDAPPPAEIARYISCYDTIACRTDEQDPCAGGLQPVDGGTPTPPPDGGGTGTPCEMKLRSCGEAQPTAACTMLGTAVNACLSMSCEQLWPCINQAMGEEPPPMPIAGCTAKFTMCGDTMMDAAYYCDELSYYPDPADRMYIQSCLTMACDAMYECLYGGA